MIGYPINKIRSQFQVLQKPITYLDSACMALKPQCVLDKQNEYYQEYPACAGRSAHDFAKKTEVEVQKAKIAFQKLISAKKPEEFVVTRNTTEGINLVANGLSLSKGDEVIISGKEHNSNLIPWLKLAKKGIIVKVIKPREDNTFDLEALQNAISNKTKLVSVVHTSNLDGVTNPIAEITKIAHEAQAKVLVDGAQSVPGKVVDVKKLDVDFLSCSGHKCMGPTGTGFLYGKLAQLEALDQFIVGGETVIDSTYTDFKIEKVPHKFEAGLQDYAGIIGFGEAARFLGSIGLKKIEKHELKLNKIISDILLQNKKVNLIGPVDPSKRSGIFSFYVKEIDPHQIAMVLNKSHKIMMRSGQHCVHSWFNDRKIEGSVRASMYAYNSEEEVEKAAHLIDQVVKTLS